MRDGARKEAVAVAVAFALQAISHKLLKVPRKSPPPKDPVGVAVTESLSVILTGKGCSRPISAASV